MSFTSDPDAAVPDGELMTLLGSLAAHDRIRPHIVSGRKREHLHTWFGDLDVGLHAEHGLWSRPTRGDEWTRLVETGTEWRDDVRTIFEQFQTRTPRSSIEEKSASLAWHYRRCDPEFGSLQAKELRLHLAEVLSNMPLEVLQGNKVIEVRLHGVNKGAAALRILEHQTDGAVPVVLGDDRTDEDMFLVMPEDAITMVVGTRSSRARYRLRNPASVRQFLNVLARS